MRSDFHKRRKTQFSGIRTKPRNYINHHGKRGFDLGSGYSKN